MRDEKWIPNKLADSYFHSKPARPTPDGLLQKPVPGGSRPLLHLFRVFAAFHGRDLPEGNAPRKTRNPRNCRNDRGIRLQEEAPERGYSRARLLCR
jgi:hypothetical protein